MSSLGSLGSLGSGGLVGLIALAAMLFAGWSAVSAQSQSAPADAPGWFGVVLRDSIDGGVEIVALAPGGPADQARLLPGDVIVEINQRPVAAQQALESVLRLYGPDDSIELLILRKGQALKPSVKLGRRGMVYPGVPVAPELPVRPTPLVRPNILGLELVEVTSDLRSHFGAPKDAGVLITRCDPGSWAAEAGLRVGDVLVQLGSSKVRTASQVRVRLGSWNLQRPLAADLMREGKPLRIEFKPAQPERLSHAMAARTAAAQLERAQLIRKLKSELTSLRRRASEVEAQLKRLESDEGER